MPIPRSPRLSRASVPVVTFGAAQRAEGEAVWPILLGGVEVGEIRADMSDFREATSRGHAYRVVSYEVEIRLPGGGEVQEAFSVKGVRRPGWMSTIGRPGTPDAVRDALSRAKAWARDQLARPSVPVPGAKPNGAAPSAKANGLPDFIAYRALPADPAAGNPLHSYGAVWADRLGSTWTVPVELPLSALAGLHPRIQTTARLASVRRARLAGEVLPPLELGVFRDGSAWIVDGNHRLVDARKAGLRTVWVRLTFVGA